MKTQKALALALLASLGGVGLSAGGGPVLDGTSAVQQPSADRTAPIPGNRTFSPSKFVRLMGGVRIPPKRRFPNAGWSVAEGKRRATKARNQARHKRSAGGGR